eukprot:CAMPEP_0194324206 /NCGR_PEP_ID=MMETSP0171-20130528/26852_1 /TAXON_ID=218684 /ORGANISM="Corethron pennatum, Strain L29A3" /LENGTH=47 /DNA_ID= /DNA_START= /DNA_END= /DNA_ORIENTATION=
MLCLTLQRPTSRRCLAPSDISSTPGPVRLPRPVRHIVNAKPCLTAPP